MMPEKSATARQNQTAALAGVIQEKKTNPKLGEDIAILLKSDFASNESPFDRAILRDAKRDFDLSANKTKQMAMKQAEVEGRGYVVWNKCRKADTWKEYEGILEEIIALKKEIAFATQPNLSPYNAQIALFERGMTTKRIDQIFEDLKKDIEPLIVQIHQVQVKRPYVPPPALLGGDSWNIESQKALCAEIAEAIGFDFSRGRIDVSVHPFTGGPHPTDVRITTRYSSDNWLEGISGTVHEAGHGMYEQGRNANYADLPVSKALSMGVHESQSLFWERMIFQSREFWVWATPLFHKHFPHTRGCTPEDFYRYVNQVKPGLIRVDADEVTYPMHIILRFELEKDLFSGRIGPSALPEQWAKAMKLGLSVDVPNYSKGVLQDIHWAMGAFGYFPSYTLGAIIAAQLYDSASKDIPDLKGKIRRGEFAPIKEYLRVRIHDVGSLYESPDELLAQATGSLMDPKIFTKYLTTKYSELYDLKLVATGKKK
jgi:carboxypeptidase Taq